jgi:hypothetical protein
MYKGCINLRFRTTDAFIEAATKEQAEYSVSLQIRPSALHYLQEIDLLHLGRAERCSQDMTSDFKVAQSSRKVFLYLNLIRQRTPTKIFEVFALFAEKARFFFFRFPTWFERSHRKGSTKSWSVSDPSLRKRGLSEVGSVAKACSKEIIGTG